MKLPVVCLFVVLIMAYLNFNYFQNTEEQPNTLQVPRAKGQEPDDALGTHLTEEHRNKVIDELKNMGYSEYLVYDYYMLKMCHDGHLGFVIAFTGIQFEAHRRFGYLCPPYINQSVEYVKKALF